MMEYRRSLNKAQGIDSYKRRDKDELLSSLFAGGTLGVFAGYIYRGKYGLFPGLFMFSAIAATGQICYSIMRHARISMALKEENFNVGSSTSIAEKIRNGPRFKDVAEVDLSQDRKRMDPIRDVYEAFTAFLKRTIDIPDWASPLVNALDVDYRKKLNYKIKMLEDQILQLEEKRRES